MKHISSEQILTETRKAGTTDDHSAWLDFYRGRLSFEHKTVNALCDELDEEKKAAISELPDRDEFISQLEADGIFDESERAFIGSDQFNFDNTENRVQFYVYLHELNKLCHSNPDFRANFHRAHSQFAIQFFNNLLSDSILATTEATDTSFYESSRLKPSSKDSVLDLSKSGSDISMTTATCGSAIKTTSYPVPTQGLSDTHLVDTNTPITKGASRFQKATAHFQLSDDATHLELAHIETSCGNWEKVATGEITVDDLTTLFSEINIFQHEFLAEDLSNDTFSITYEETPENTLTDENTDGSFSEIVDEDILQSAKRKIVELLRTHPGLARYTHLDETTTVKIRIVPGNEHDSACIAVDIYDLNLSDGEHSSTAFNTSSTRFIFQMVESENPQFNLFRIQTSSTDIANCLSDLARRSLYLKSNTLPESIQLTSQLAKNKSRFPYMHSAILNYLHYQSTEDESTGLFIKRNLSAPFVSIKQESDLGELRIRLTLLANHYFQGGDTFIDCEQDLIDLIKYLRFLDNDYLTLDRFIRFEIDALRYSAQQCENRTMANKAYAILDALSEKGSLTSFHTDEMKLDLIKCLYHTRQCIQEADSPKVANYTGVRETASRYLTFSDKTVDSKLVATYHSTRARIAKKFLSFAFTVAGLIPFKRLRNKVDSEIKLEQRFADRRAINAALVKFSISTQKYAPNTRRPISRADSSLSSSDEERTNSTLEPNPGS